jgi:hypothetical protein
MTRSNSTATLWTALCNNKSIGTWPSSSNVQVRILIRLCLYIHSDHFRRHPGSRGYRLCKGRRTRYHETVLTRDAHGDSFPDYRLDQWQRRCCSTGAVAIWPCGQGQISHRPHDCQLVQGIGRPWFMFLFRSAQRNTLLCQ